MGFHDPLPRARRLSIFCFVFHTISLQRLEPKSLIECAWHPSVRVSLLSALYSGRIFELYSSRTTDLLSTVFAKSVYVSFLKTKCTNTVRGCNNAWNINFSKSPVWLKRLSTQSRTIIRRCGPRVTEPSLILYGGRGNLIPLFPADELFI